MNRDYDWLMMVMSKYMEQYDRGLLTKKEFDDEIGYVLMIFWDNMAIENE